MSHIFQRPLCELGRAYDFAFRPVLGEPEPSMGGGCDQRAERIALFAADALPTRPDAERRGFLLCAEHLGQLRAADRKLIASGRASRFVPRAQPSGPE